MVETGACSIPAQGKRGRGVGERWPPARSRLTSGADMKLCCFLLFVFLFRFVFFLFCCLLLSLFKFCCVFFSCRYHIRMQTNSSLFLTRKSSVRSLVISRDTSCDSV